MVALFVCKCLNLSIESDAKVEDVDSGKLELTATEQRDIFFSEKLVACPSSSVKMQLAQSVLLGQRHIGRFSIQICLACGQHTHAVNLDKPMTTLISKAIMTTVERVNSLKKSKNFSPVYNLLVPEVTNDVEMKENVDTNNLNMSSDKGLLPALPIHQVIGTLSKQLNQTLQSSLEAVEEAVRQFRDQKYAEFEAFRERAHRDHKILASIVSKARRSSDGESWRVDPSLDNGPPSPQLPPLQRRRLSSSNAKKISHQPKPNRHIPQEEDSLDAEDIFDLEGTDSRHNMISDQDDYDSDPEGSNDEGIGIGRARGGAAAAAAAADIARSLPINMPNFPLERAAPSDLDDDEEPQDIAASIKALARSVHGDAFELPRPRFSTQI